MWYILYFFFNLKKCSLFHNSNVFGSCIIHILYTGVLKLKKFTFYIQDVLKLKKFTFNIQGVLKLKNSHFIYRVCKKLKKFTFYIHGVLKFKKIHI